MFTKILVPLDGSPVAEAVLPMVRDIAESKQAHIVLFHNAESITMHSFSPEAIVSIDVYEIERTARNDALNYLEHTAAHLRDRGIHVTVDLQSQPSVAGAIIDAVERHGADLIAMATNGRGGLGRVLLGSTADRVVHLSAIPVLLVRPDQSKYG